MAIDTKMLVTFKTLAWPTGHKGIAAHNQCSYTAWGGLYDSQLTNPSAIYLWFNQEHVFSIELGMQMQLRQLFIFAALSKSFGESLMFHFLFTSHGGYHLLPNPTSWLMWVLLQG